MSKKRRKKKTKLKVRSVLPKEQILAELTEDLANMPDISEYGIEDVYKFTVKSFQKQLVRALAREATRRGMSPMARIAQLFYADGHFTVQILKHLLPQLKSVETRFDQDNPIRLLLDMSKGRTGEEKTEKEMEEELDEKDEQ